MNANTELLKILLIIVQISMIFTLTEMFFEKIHHLLYKAI